jgi:hypothetical protein
MRLYVRSWSISALSKSPANRSRTIRSGSSASWYTSAGALAVLAFAWIVFQSRCRKTRSRSMSSADAPSAAVRTMMPPSLASSFLMMSLRRVRSAVVEPARDAEPLALRDEDEEAAGKRDLGREPRALRLHRVLDRLHHDLLAAGDQVGDLLAVPLALELGHDDLVDVQEAVLLEADLDERGLHARQHVVDGAEVDVPGDRAALGPLEIDLGDAVVLEDRDALLADVDGDQQLALRLRQRRTLLRHAAAVALLVGTAFLALAALGRLALPLRGLRLQLGLLVGLLGGRNGGAGAGLLTPAPATAATTSSLGGIGCRPGLSRGGGLLSL